MEGFRGHFSVDVVRFMLPAEVSTVVGRRDASPLLPME
jgi:hypothetical protein